jgi:hypothetical protein
MPDALKPLGESRRAFGSGRRWPFLRLRSHITPEEQATHDGDRSSEEATGARGRLVREHLDAPDGRPSFDK